MPVVGARSASHPAQPGPGELTPEPALPLGPGMLAPSAGRAGNTCGGMTRPVSAESHDE